jgi:hypothetical protein
VQNKRSAIFFSPLVILLALFINGNAGIKLCAPADNTLVYHLSPGFVAQPTLSDIRKTEIKEIRIKIRYMGSECNHFVATVPRITFSPLICEETKFLRHLSLVNIYFLDSFRLRGPPSIA